MLHLVVLCGGQSVEHEISFLSAASVLAHLDPERYRTSVIAIRRDGTAYGEEQARRLLGNEVPSSIHFPRGGHWVETLLGLRPPAEVVFPVLHGPFGEDGTVQGLLEMLDLAYVGSGVWGSAVGMNKIGCKRVLEAAGLPVLPFVALERRRWEAGRETVLEHLESALPYPMFVKPASMGSSVGVNRSRSRGELETHLEEAFEYDDHVLVEKGIEAREIEVAVLGGVEAEASLAGEIVPADDFYTYEAKYVKESRLLVPAPLEEERMGQVRQLALKAFELLELEGMARMDFLLEESSGIFWINEPNTIPGFTRISMYPRLWAASGLSYPSLLDRLVALGVERRRRRRERRLER